MKGEIKDAPGACVYAFPMRPQFTAQLVIPRDMTVGEAERIKAFVLSLVVAPISNAPPTLADVLQSLVLNEEVTA